MALTPDALRKKALELVYYSGAAESGNNTYWQRHAASQEAYMELCQRGHTLIANQIIEGVRNGHPPSIKELYQTAARVRRAIAIINQPQSPQCLQFGQPLATSGNNQLRDIIQSEGDNRFKEYFVKLREDFNRILEHVQKGTFKEAFGEEYSAKIAHADHETRITISRTSPRVDVATLGLSNDGNTIVLMHAKVKDRDALFAKADAHLRHILSHPEMNEAVLMQELGAISLELFHAAPLKRGSQTATLMVMAGISKAAGLDIVPRVMRTDHFIEAETTPYRDYIRDYGGKFMIPPQRSKPPAQPIDVDDHFIALASQRLRNQYIQIANPADRLTHYIRDSEDPFFQVPATVKELEITDRKITKLHIQPRNQQASIEQALEFIGHEEILDSLGLEPGKYVASHMSRAHAQKTAPRQR